MTDTLDPRQVEEQSQAEQENYKVYKRRWLVLFAMFSVTLVVGLHRCLISIAIILDKYMGMTIDDYDLVGQVSMYTILITVLAMARAIDYFGLRRIAYVACMMILCANGLKALCCCDEKYVTVWVKDHRFDILVVSEIFVGLAQAICFCIPAKVSSAWFANYESTLALVIANCGFNIGIGFSNYFTPLFIKSVDDIYKLSFMFLISGLAVTLIVLTCVTRSSPKLPPSLSAMMSSSSHFPMRNGIAVMITDPNYVLLLFALALNVSTSGVTQYLLDDILVINSYSDSFCGTLIAHAYFFGTFFMLMGAAWVDNSANYVKVSRIASMICALSMATFNISIILPNIKNVILVTNVMASFGCSLMYPALFQVCLRSATTILPEATVSAIVIILQQILSAILMNSFSPLRRLSPEPTGYQAPMIIFAIFVMVVNVLYATSFKAPSREELQNRLQNMSSRTILVNEQSG